MCKKSQQLKIFDYLELYVSTNPSTHSRFDTRLIFKWSLTGLNIEFSFYIGCHTKFKEPCLPYNLLIAGGKIVGCLPFSKVSVL